MNGNNYTSQTGLFDQANSAGTNIGTYNSIVPTGTITFWIKPLGSGQTCTPNAWDCSPLFSVGQLYDGIQFLSSDTIQVYHYNGSAQFLEGNTQIATGTWTNVAVAWSSAGTILYINGNIDATSSQPFMTNCSSCEWDFLQETGVPANTFNGWMDDAGIWLGTELTQSQIQILIGGGGGGLPNINIIAPPTNQGTTAPINYINAQITNLNATTTYTITENTTYSTGGFLGFGTVVNNIPGLSQTNTGAFFDRFGYSTGFTYPTNNPGSNISMNTTITVNYANIQGSTIPITSSSIQWYMIPVRDANCNFLTCAVNATSTVINNFPIYLQATSTQPVTTPYGGTVATSTLIQGINNIISDGSSTAACSQWNVPAIGIFDIGNGLLYAGCQLINITFIPSPTFTNAIYNSINKFQGIFPFNLYYAIVGGVQSDLQIQGNSTSTQNLSMSVEGLHGENINMITVTPTFLADALTVPSTTSPFGGTLQSCNSTCANEKVNNAWLPIKMGVWIIAGIKIVGMITSF